MRNLRKKYTPNIKFSRFQTPTTLVADFVYYLNSGQKYFGNFGGCVKKLLECQKNFSFLECGYVMNCAFEFESKGGLIQHFFFQDLRV
jgi:hypothetical protein